MIYLIVTCFLIQSVVSQMVPQISYQQMYQPNVPQPNQQLYQQNPNPMQYFNPQAMLGQIEEPTIRRRSGRKKKSKKRNKHKKPIQRTYSSDECSGDTSGSSSRSASHEECRCSCDQCAQPIQCCVQLCATCPVPGPGILLVPYPYPMLITQQTKKKSKEPIKESSKEKNNDIPKDKDNTKENSKEKTKEDSGEREENNSKENETDQKLRSGRRKKTTKKFTKITKNEKTNTKEATTSKTITEATTTQSSTAQETTTIGFTSESDSLSNATQVSARSNMDTFSDLYDYPRYKEYATHSYKDDIDALYREIGRKHGRGKFNDIIYKAPKKVGESNTKYVMASLRNVKQDWLPKYGIVPIPDNMAAELIMSLNEMKSIQAIRDTKVLQANEATEHRDKHHLKSRRMDRFRPPYVEHLYQRHRRTFK